MTPQPTLMKIIAPPIKVQNHWKQELMQQTPTYKLTQLIREAYLLSNRMRKNVWLQVITTSPQNQKWSINFDPNYLKHLTPDSRSIYYLIHHSMNRYWLKQQGKRAKKPLPGIRIKEFHETELKTDLLIREENNNAIRPCQQLKQLKQTKTAPQTITVNLNPSGITPPNIKITPQQQIQWNPLWQIITILFNTKWEVERK